MRLSSIFHLVKIGLHTKNQLPKQDMNHLLPPSPTPPKTYFFAPNLGCIRISLIVSITCQYKQTTLWIFQSRRYLCTHHSGPGPCTYYIYGLHSLWWLYDNNIHVILIRWTRLLLCHSQLRLIWGWLLEEGSVVILLFTSILFSGWPGQNDPLCKLD